MSIRPGSYIGEQYQVIKTLGQGATGMVFLAQDKGLNRPVAIKMLHRSVADSLEIDGRFRREARLLSRLNHPNLVTVYAFGLTDEEEHYIVMEYVEGTPLDVLLEGQGQLTLGFLCQVVDQVTSALEEAHAHGIVHRDLKPGNIIVRELDDRLHVTVVDFGLARRVTESAHDITRDQSVVVGSPLYMAPEQVRSTAVDSRADIYALGVMACEMLTGCTPFEESDSVMKVLFSRLKQEPMMPSTLRPDLGFEPGGDIDRVFQTALAREPEARYQRARELSRDLIRALWTWRPEAISLDGFGVGSSVFDVVLDHMQPSESPLIRAARGEAWEEAIDRSPVHVIREVTVLYLRLEHGTVNERYRDARTLDPVDELEGMGLLHARIRQAVGPYRGVPLEALSDRYVLLFGLAPNELSIHERAIDAALALRLALWNLNRDPLLPDGLQFTFRLALEAGPVTLQQERDVALFATGAALFRARSLVEGAEEGSLVITDELYRRVRDLYHCSLAERQQARQVLMKRPLSLQSSHQIGGVRFDCLGRDEEVAELHKHWHRTRSECSANVLVVEGTYGVGKSTAVQELVKRVLDDPSFSRVYIGRCSPFHHISPFAPFTEAIRNHARLDDGDHPDMVRTRLSQFFVQKLAADPERLTDEERVLLEFLEQLLGLDHEAEADLTFGQDLFIEHAASQGRTLTMMVHLMRVIIERFPMLFVLEDFQWASQPTRELVNHLLNSDATRGVLFVLVTRTHDKPAALSFLSPHHIVHRLPISPLADEALDALVSHMLRRLPSVPESLIDNILELAQGMPLTAAEYVREIVDSGVVLVEDGRWRFNDALEQVALPATVEELFSARYRRLEGSDLTELADAAAVAGQVFWPTMLAAMCGQEERDASGVAALVGRGFLVERRDSVVHGERSYSFSKPVMGEVIYGQLSGQRRRRLHKRAAHWLVRRVGAALPGFEVVIAKHFERASLFTEAFEYYLRGARRAAQVGLHEESIEHYEQGLRCLERSKRGKDRERMALKIHAEVLQQLLNAGRAEDALTRVQSLFSQPSQRSVGDEVRFELARGTALLKLERSQQALASFERAFTLSGRAKDDGFLKLSAATRAARAALELDAPKRALMLLEPPLSQIRSVTGMSAEWHLVVTRANVVLGRAHFTLQQLDEAEQRFLKGYRLAMGANAPALLVEAIMGRGLVHHARKQPAKAEKAWRSGIAIARERQLVSLHAELLRHLADLARSYGDANTAIERYEKAAQIYASLQKPSTVLQLCKHLVACCQATGDTMRALGYAHEAFRVAVQSTPGQVDWAVELLVGFADRLLESSIPDPLLLDKLKSILNSCFEVCRRLGLDRACSRLHQPITSVSELELDDTGVTHRPDLSR